MLKGWRTLIFNGLVIAAGVTAFLVDAPISPGWVIPVGVANVILRAVTTSPIGGK